MNIKIGYAYMWGSFFEEREKTPPIWELCITSLGYKIEIIDSPFSVSCDIVIRSVFDDVNHGKPYVGKPIVLEYSAESYLGGNYDFSISHSSDSVTNLYFPLWLMEKTHYGNVVSNSICNAIKDPLNRKFCSCIISNRQRFTKPRRRIYRALSLYKHIDCGGAFHNNVGGSIDKKQDFIPNYKFYFCPENCNLDGYITEKIMDAYVNGCVPIYYGGGDSVFKYFNKDSFICCNNKSLFEIYKEVKHVDKDDDLYIKMLNAPKFVNPEFYNERIEALSNFLLNIINCLS